MKRASVPSRAGWALAALVALSACGGAGVGIPEDAGNAKTTEERKAVTAQAIDSTAALRQAVSAAVANGQPLADMQKNFGDLPVALPSGGAVSAVRLEFGGVIVADLNLPDASKPAAAQATALAGKDIPPSAQPPQTPGQGQLLWVAYPAAPGVVRWYCFGNWPSASTDTNGACLYPGDAARGMTWGTANGPAAAGLTPYNARYNMSMVDCNVTTPATLGRPFADNACNPYDGDWHVLRKLPLLCVRKTNAPPPSGWVRPEGSPRTFVGGEVAVTPPVYGTQLLGAAPGDQLCTEQFGAGWTMASFHDAGGWGFFGIGRTPTDTRFWVRIRDQAANPWCATLTGLPCTNTTATAAGSKSPIGARG